MFLVSQSDGWYVYANKYIFMHFFFLKIAHIALKHWHNTGENVLRGDQDYLRYRIPEVQIIWKILKLFFAHPDPLFSRKNQRILICWINTQDDLTTREWKREIKTRSQNVSGLVTSVVDPYILCKDPDPESQQYTGTDPTASVSGSGCRFFWWQTQSYASFENFTYFFELFFNEFNS